MIELLEELYLELQNVFEGNLKLKEKKMYSDNEIDVFQTFMTLTKSQKEFRSLIEKSALPKEVLIYKYRDFVNEALDNKYIQAGSAINDNKLFITSNGLYHYYNVTQKKLNNVFISYDELRFPTDILNLKTQEKILCIFLILFGADDVSKKLDTSKASPETLNKYFNFLQDIEDVVNANNLNIGKNIGWGKGKDISFRKFITNTVDLPKTGFYFYPNSKYYLDLTKRKNVKYLLDLVLDNYSGEQRIIANGLLYDAIYNLSNKMLTDLGELPRPINRMIKEELRG